MSCWTGAPGGAPRPHAPRSRVPTGVDVSSLCRNGGLCVDAGTTHHCRCQAGYAGSYCEDQVDECSPSPCRNGATCTDYPGGYSCEVGPVPGEGVRGVSSRAGPRAGSRCRRDHRAPQVQTL